MSIASQISRIQQNVSDSLIEVANKGVLVPAGSTSDDLPELIAQITSGAGSAITVTDTLDENGGTIRTITAVSLEGDTVSPGTLLQGYTAHNSLGEAIVGTMDPGSSPTGTINITTNGTHDVSAYASANVQVPTGGATLQAKTHIAPTESSQTITADTGYDGLSSVQIDAVSSTYVGSGITRRDGDDLTASGATVTVPAGYYSAQASKAVSSGTATAPTSISGTSATVSAGSNTLTLTKTVSVTPRVTTAGYISAGTAGNASVTLTANVTTKAAATITPTKSTQTILSGTYLTGTQTIAAIPDAYQDVSGVTAAAGDVVSGKSIVSSTGATVTGTLVIQHYYTGSSAPSSSLGENGDIYLQTT